MMLPVKSKLKHPKRSHKKHLSNKVLSSLLSLFGNCIHKRESAERLLKIAMLTIITVSFPTIAVGNCQPLFKNLGQHKRFLWWCKSRFICMARLGNVFPKQSYRWQYVVFTELFPRVNLLTLAESKIISFLCSYNALRMRTPKSMEKVEAHSKKSLLAWVLANRA